MARKEGMWLRLIKTAGAGDHPMWQYYPETQGGVAIYHSQGETESYQSLAGQDGRKTGKTYYFKGGKE